MKGALLAPFLFGGSIHLFALWASATILGTMSVIKEQALPPACAKRFLISDLCTTLESYLDADAVKEIYHAYLFGAEAHDGQIRASGEPYIHHPLEVANILALMRLDKQTIIAAILHDVIEDTRIAKEQIVALFGAEVAELVDGVSKLTHLTFQNREEAQAENFRKVLLAMVKDIRVILIKIADRLHNMRTLKIMPAYKQRRIAKETLEIFAPIANRLGMNTIKLELEDLGFEAYYPSRYRVLQNAVIKGRGNRKEIVQNIETSLKRCLHQEELTGEVVGREKHLYSIYSKMHIQKLSFSDVFDVYGFRVIVDKVDTCYRVLGAVHNLFKPVPGRFKDYIAIPKANGYQSLHTVLFGPYGIPIEIQIRTNEMDEVAESGIAAHWLYKSGDGRTGADGRAREWLRSLLEMQKSAGNSLEFLENVKIDLFPDEIYVFTPKGKIIKLARGATPVDFAYAVHSDVGNTCVAAKIDRRLAPLAAPLHNGQTVEIIATPGASPNPSWLSFAVTGKARACIRHFLKQLKEEEAIALGQRLLDKSLSNFSTQLANIAPALIQQLTQEYQVTGFDIILKDIGLGNRMAAVVARRLVPMNQQSEETGLGEQSRPLIIKGTEGMVINFAKCCRPIPGDRIVGFVSTGRGIIIHTNSCRNLQEYRNLPEKWIQVEWEENITGEFVVEMRVDVANQRGVLAMIASSISETGANIENLEIEEKDGINTSLNFTLSVKNRKHLADIMRRIRIMRPVVHIARSRS